MALQYTNDTESYCSSVAEMSDGQELGRELSWEQSWQSGALHHDKSRGCNDPYSVLQQL